MNYFKNAISKLYEAVSAPVAATRDALAERLQSVRETAALLCFYYAIMLYYYVVEEQAEQEHPEQEEENNDLTPEEHELAMNRSYRSFRTPGLPNLGRSNLGRTLYNTVRAQIAAALNARNALAFKDYDGAMLLAAINGHLEIVKLCKEWGATDYDGAMWWATINGHLEIVKLCKEWGALAFKDYDGAMRWAALDANIEIVRCRGWLDYDAIHDDLLRHHHKREFYGGLKDELVPIAWHPDRWWDWCVDEDKKREAEKLWS